MEAIKKSNKDSQINLFRGIMAESTYYLETTSIAICRGMWINFVRITKFIQQTCQGTHQSLRNQVNYPLFRLVFSAMNVLKDKIELNVIKYLFLLVFLNLTNF